MKSKAPKPPEQRKPGIRIDGGKRRDLNGERVAARMAGVLAGVSDEKAAEAYRKRRRSNDAKAEREGRKLRAEDGGKEGALVTKVRLRVSGQRTATQQLRCRPGTFEWRYGRERQEALFHAGNQFAQLAERMGITVASSANFLRGTTSGYATSISEGRLEAMNKLYLVMKKLGHDQTDRLIEYCVRGQTTGEIAASYGFPEKSMAAVLDADLRSCAKWLKVAA